MNSDTPYNDSPPTDCVQRSRGFDISKNTFSPLKIRLGGTLQDKLTYGTQDNKQHCTTFVLNPNELFGFTQGCLPMKR
ncbi:glycoside hydrolase family 79 amino-terminal domain protein [Medicago truncatula]|uniref:Glycoside hydrolase family 79 amino-terminal domain protein n=1 Tax=Medicago truncatula TaxID=3880 RepID=G7JGK9_MEDTR|nr:glycoside hydrolase family 79 amino-terminal domain protein [Medicago truncatula]